MKLVRNSQLDVVEISGRSVFSTTVRPGEVTKQLDFSFLPAGTYFVSLQQNGQMVREKLLLVNN